MKHLLHRLRKHGIGRRALTIDDFWRICADEDIEVFWSRKRYPFYFTVPDDDLRVIVLPDRLARSRLLFAAYHELAHHFLHGGDEPCLAFMGLSDHKCEAEADAVALVALIPKSHLFVSGYDFGDSPFARRLWNERLKLFFLYGI